MSSANMPSTSKPEKKWTPQEDEILRAAVAQFGTKNSWQKISERLPGRSNKSCRKRWIHSLDPQLRKGRWTAAEDAKLKEAIKEHGLQWWKVARQIEGRTDDQCAKRWREKLDPSISRRPWSALEDQTLMDAWRIHGKRWNVISTMLPGRPAVHCRNRYQSLTRVSRRSTNSAASADSSTPVLLASSHGRDSEEDVDRKPSKYELDSLASGTQFMSNGSPLRSPFDFGRRASWQGNGMSTDQFIPMQRYPSEASPSLSFDSPRSSSGLTMSPASLPTASPPSSEELQLPPTLAMDFDSRIAISPSGYEDSRYRDSTMGMPTLGRQHYPQAMSSSPSLHRHSFDGRLQTVSSHGHDSSLPSMSYSPSLPSISQSAHSNPDNVDLLLDGLGSRWGTRPTVVPQSNQRLASFTHLAACASAAGDRCNCHGLSGQPSDLRAYMELAASKGTDPNPVRGLWPGQPSAGGDQSSFFSPSLGGLRDVSLPGQHRSIPPLANSATPSSCGAPFSTFPPGYGTRSASSSPASTAGGVIDPGGTFPLGQLTLMARSN